MTPLVLKHNYMAGLGTHALLSVEGTEQYIAFTCTFSHCAIATHLCIENNLP